MLSSAMHAHSLRQHTNSVTVSTIMVMLVEGHAEEDVIKTLNKLSYDELQKMVAINDTNVIFYQAVKIHFGKHPHKKRHYPNLVNHLESRLNIHEESSESRMPKESVKTAGNKVLDAIWWPIEKASLWFYGKTKEEELADEFKARQNVANTVYQRGYRDGQAAHCHRHSRLFTHRHKKHHGHHHTHSHRASPSKQ